MQKWGGSADENIERKSKAEKKKAESKTSKRREIDWSKKRVNALVNVDYNKLIVNNICICIVYYIFHSKNKYRYLNYPNQANCVTVSFQFPPMSVTYQVNYLVKCSEYLCDISGKLYHFIIPFSGDVSDIWGQLPCQIIFLYFLLELHIISFSNFAKLAVYLVGWVASLSFTFSCFVTTFVTHPNHITFWGCLLYI